MWTSQRRIWSLSTTMAIIDSEMSILAAWWTTLWRHVVPVFQNLLPTLWWQWHNGWNQPINNVIFCIIPIFKLCCIWVFKDLPVIWTVMVLRKTLNLLHWFTCVIFLFPSFCLKNPILLLLLLLPLLLCEFIPEDAFTWVLSCFLSEYAGGKNYMEWLSSEALKSRAGLLWVEQSLHPAYVSISQSILKFIYRKHESLSSKIMPIYRSIAL